MRALMFLLLGLAFSISAQAFTLNSNGNSNLKGWSSPNIQLFVNTAHCPSNVDVVAIIEDAVELWNNVPSSNIKVSYGGSTGGSTYSSPTTVYCETNFGSIGSIDSVPGAASVQTSSGQISAGVLYLNASSGKANIGNFDHTKLKIILAHEIGHILGLGHSASTNALMYYNASAKNTLSLSQDDIDGVSYLYPSNEFSDNTLAGCGSVRSSSETPRFTGGLLAALLFMPLVLWVALRISKTSVRRHFQA